MTTRNPSAVGRAISAEPLPKRFRIVDGKRMAFHERGDGEAIVFLHGNPTSSYLWRNVIPHVRDLGRCLAPDLVGMGESGKLPDPGPGTYSFAAHAAHLDAWFDTVLPAGPVTLVLHDWGS